MIIVAGRLYVDPSCRDAFLGHAREAVIKARTAPGCRDFVVAADPIEAGRVNVYEMWETEAQLARFRGAGPAEQLNAQILRADVSSHQIAASRPA